MITKEVAELLCHGDILHHIKLINSDGTPIRCRINGVCRTWKRDPGRFRLPVKYGLKFCFYLTPGNAHEWEMPAETAQKVAHRKMCIQAGLPFHTPLGIVEDKLKDMGVLES